MASIVVYKAKYTFINKNNFEIENLEEISRTPVNELNKQVILTKAKEISSFNGAEILAITKIHKISESGTGTPKVVFGENMVMEE